jgi:hypothetical protein
MKSQSIGTRFVELPNRPRTFSELLDELKVPASTLQNFLRKPRLPPGEEIISWKNRQAEVLYERSPLPTVRQPPPPRTFRFVTNKQQAYHRVFIPNNVVDKEGKPANKITIYPFSDVHWGHKECDKKNFILDLKMVESTPNMFTYFNGDAIDNAHGDSAGGAAWSEQDMDPREQRFSFEKVIARVQHKTLFMIPGNHEERTEKKTLLNPIEEIAHALDIPYFAGPTNMEVVWGGYRWTFYCYHGSGNSGQTGGQINSAEKPRASVDFRNFFISGHVHNQVTSKYTRPIRTRKFDEHGNLLEFDKVDAEEYVIILPSYLLYDSSYAWKAGYRPGSRNTVSIDLYRNGKCFVNTEKRQLNGDSDRPSV